MGPNQGYRVTGTNDWTVTDASGSNWENWAIPGVPFFYPVSHEPGTTQSGPANTEHCKGPLLATSATSSTTTADSRYFVNLRGSSFESAPAEASASHIQSEMTTVAPSRAPDGDHGPPRMDFGVRERTPTIDLTQERQNSKGLRANGSKENKAHKISEKKEVKKSKLVKESSKRKNAIDWKKVRKYLKKRIYNLSENDLNLLYRLYRAKYRCNAPQISVKSYNNLVELFWREANGSLFSVCRLFNLLHIMEKVSDQEARETLSKGGMDSFYDDLLQQGSSLKHFLVKDNCAPPPKKYRQSCRSKQSNVEDLEDSNLKNSCSIS